MKNKTAKKKSFTRREFVKTSVAASFGINIIGCSKKPKKPNLLFIWTDEQRADTMRIYGNSAIHAPNLNKLTEESVVFQHPYVSQPVCTPSRSTVMTGLWPHTNTCVQNNIPLPENIPCLPELINDPDYRTGHFGKWHLGDEIFPQHGFEEWESIEDGYVRFYRNDKYRAVKSSYWKYLKSLGYEPDNDEGNFGRNFVSRLPYEHSKSKYLERQTCDFLRRHQQDPFILYLNFLEPHPPINGPFNDEHHLSEILLPRNLDDPLEENEPLRYRLNREKFYNQGYKKYSLKTESDWKEIIKNYWGLVTQVDRSVGEILNTLENLGLAEDTIVVYTSDHGDMMGSHRMITKRFMYEEAIKVPWIMRIPQMRRSQHLIKNRVSHIDLVPTLLDLMGKRDHGEVQGKSIVPLINGEVVQHDNVFVEWNPKRIEPDTLPTIPGVSQQDVDRVMDASIRTVIAPDGWKLCWSDKDKNQLFNLNKDPLETQNLYYMNESQHINRRLKKSILDWQKRSGDKLVI